MKNPAPVYHPLGRDNAVTRHVARIRTTMAQWDGGGWVGFWTVAAFVVAADGEITYLLHGNVWAWLAVVPALGALGLLTGRRTRVAEVAPWYAAGRDDLDELARLTGDAGHVRASLGVLRHRLDDLNTRWVTVRTAHRQLIATYPAAFTHQKPWWRDEAQTATYTVDDLADSPAEERDWLDPDLRAATAAQRAELEDAYAAIAKQFYAWQHEVATLTEGSRQRARLHLVGVQVADVPALDAVRDAVAGLPSGEDLAAIQASASAYLDAVENLTGRA